MTHLPAFAIVALVALNCHALPSLPLTPHGSTSGPHVSTSSTSESTTASPDLLAYPAHFPTPTETYISYEQLDPNGEYFLFWKSNKTHIQFEVHVKTRGYVGFGISHNGAMFPADVVIGWVDSEGTVHFKDRHTIGHYEPIIDDSQDWTLIAGAENDFGTMLKFSRPIETCDVDDITISHGTSKVIYSYYHEDPVHETGLTYHGSNRGSKSVLLLDKNVPKSIPSNSKHTDFVNVNFHIRPQRTFYHCTVYELPKLTTKEHMIMYEPIITPGNEDIVHHILVYLCPHNMAKYNGMDFECYESSIRELDTCKATFLAWAVGGGPFYLPENVGYPLGEEGGPSHVIVETHYNNPTLAVGRVDNSGIRMHYTPTLRLHDAGMLESGVSVDEFQVIPPNYEHFKSSGVCSARCIRNSLLRTQSQEINIFSVFQHAHLLARGIKTRLIRNGTELEPIMEDKYYDFDYQESRLLSEERVLKVGDQIVVECDYNSRRRSDVTYGGLSTSEEMCLSFLMYYPRMPMANCLSNTAYEKFIPVSHHHSQNIRALFRYMDAQDWSNSTIRDSFQINTDNSKHQLYCMDYSGPQSWSGNMEMPDPIHTPYVPPASICT